MKTIREAMKVGVVMVVVFILATFLFSRWGVSTADAGKAMAGLTRIEHMQMSGRKITGHLVNLSADRLESVTLRFKTYDDDGAMVGEAFESIERLSGHERWSFSAYAGSRAGQYALSEVLINGMRVPKADMAVSYLADEEKVAKVANDATLAVSEAEAKKRRNKEIEAAAEWKSSQAKAIAEKKAKREAEIKAAVEKFRAEQAAKKDH